MIRENIRTQISLLKNLNLNLKLYFGAFAIYSLVQTPFYIATLFLVYVWGGTDIDVGLIFGTTSLVGILGLIVSGILSDKWRRDAFIWISNFLFIAGMIIYFFANSLTYLYIIQFLFALANSLMMPAGSALVADCTTKGTRTKIFTIMSIIQQLCTAIGGVVGFFIYRYLGDLYSEEVILPVIKIYASVIIFAAFLGFFIHDKRSIHSKGQIETKEILEEKKKDALILSKYKNCKTFREKLSFYRTPLIIVLADFLIAFGAGISIPFLPRFFEAIYGRTISELTLIFSLAPLITAILSAIALRFAKKFGRAKAVFFLEFIAVVLIFGFAFIPPFSIVLVIYILRQAFMNAGWPLINAIVMDLLPSNQRATFSAIDALAFTAFNSISQPIGGVILNKYDKPFNFQLAFYITGSIYFIGTFFLLFIKEGNYETEEVENLRTDE
ncbi:MAG: MFS transporter [Candidatus Heimdallarchaeaceae archaeon]